VTNVNTADRDRNGTASAQLMLEQAKCYCGKRMYSCCSKRLSKVEVPDVAPLDELHHDLKPCNDGYERDSQTLHERYDENWSE
jgi:hypothetical protein